MGTIVRHEHTLRERVIGGIISGVAGGLVFGMMMGMMGMLSMVGGVVGSQSPLVGFAYHMFNSVVIGAIFGFAFGNRSHTFAQGAVWGLLYGFLWWILGPLVLMTLMMGMPLQFGAAFETPVLMSLMGHLIYGVINGLVYVWYTHR